jgi:aminoglycoside 6'-N-acetyltransferase I
VIQLRRLTATDTDLAEVATRLNEADSEVSLKTFTAKSLKDFLRDPERFYLIGYVGSQIAGVIHGYALHHPAGVKYLYIDEVDTMERFRRQGVATAMMKEVFEIGREYGCDEAWLGTEADNDAAKALYLGLKPSEVENGPIYSWKLTQPSSRP